MRRMGREENWKFQNKCSGAPRGIFPARHHPGAGMVEAAKKKKREREIKRERIRTLFNVK